ncbi:M48 family metallopeptidase [Ramlibacter sp. MMS24-I3-19]|uniref:M48 family metallopeptidase n=1 Tax=Ramlibacter sp. MMS24-I3-19 TaxID=3416606 RepID=UPI003D058A53
MDRAFHARWFDGRSSAGQLVHVALSGSPRGPVLRLLQLGTGTHLLELGPREVRWPESWSTQARPKPLAVDLGRHGSLQVDDGSLWHRAQAAAGHRPTLAPRMQTRWTVLAGACVMALAALAAFYHWGTPWAATRLTAHVPLAWEIGLSERALRDLDGRHLRPSRLPVPRQQALRAQFDQLASRARAGHWPDRGYAPVFQLAFRAGLGANALALPGGQIVMTDGLVETAAARGLSDDALLGVLAHEIGHVAHRHTTRMLVEPGVLNIGLGLALGDVPTLVSSGASLLTGLAYQRGHEAQADCFALALMREAGIATAPTADLLTAIDSHGSEGPAWSALLSSHPQTPERAAALRAGKAEGCS